MSTLNEQLWNESINEFIDWDNGISSVERITKTDGLKVSGGMIRELLQDRLKHPIFVKDTGDGYIRIFSSQKAYEYWSAKPSEWESQLVLYKMPKASEYDAKLTIIGTEGSRYINSAAGFDMNEETDLNLNWVISKNGSIEPQQVKLDFSIENKTTGKTETFSDTYSASVSSATYKLASMLDLGQNLINVYLSSNKGATASVQLTINVFTFNLNVDFDYFDSSTHEFEQPIRIAGYKVTRNIKNAPVTIKCNIDGRDIALGNEHEYPANKDVSFTGLNIDELLSYNPEESATDPRAKVIHKMQMWAETTFANSTNVFTSNVCYWTFEIPAQTTNTIYNHFLDFYTSIDSTKIVSTPVGSVKLYASQYIPFELNYSHYTDSMRDDLSITVYWYLVQNGVETFIKSTKADKGVESVFKFTPEIYTDEALGKSAYLVAKRFDETLVNHPEMFEELLNIEMIISKGSGFKEADGYELKLSAFGRTNDESDEMSIWKYKKGSTVIDTKFTNIDWSAINGWNNDAFRTCGSTSYAEVLYQPFSSFDANWGKTIEIDFESEKVNSTEDVIVLIGNKTGARIEITPNRASLFNNAGTNIVETNFKSNERVHLAFIFNTQNDITNVNNSLVYIVNNGIFERAGEINGSIDSVLKTNGYIKFGGSRSGVKIYSLRVYNKALTYTQAYDNFIYDAPNKIELRNNNDILNDETELIDYDKCLKKMDVILIEGNLTDLLKSGTNKEDSETDVTISRFSRNNPDKEFVCKNAKIRKHGQSTLNYPVPSMKVWFNKSKSGVNPVFTCEGQKDLGLSKNRYVMKDGCIPSNKFVLQANYADSSGVHNGSFQRLINNTWYNAVIDKEYKLRTQPQLFSTNKKITRTDDTNLHDNNDLHKDLTYGVNEEGKQWKDYFTDPFPYKMIEYGPESFPCVVFYSNNKGEKTFLGQYVFMEDKKADFLYGERSMYCDKTGRLNNYDDPFVLTVKNNTSVTIPGRDEPGGIDNLDENIIWDNKDVLRIEGITINSLFSSFVSWTNSDRVAFDSIVDELDEKGNPTGNQIYCFERDFEMIYPDPDDIQGKDNTADGGKDTTKFGADSKFLKKAKPFIDFYKWVTDTKNNYANTTEWWTAGTYESAQEAFINTASSHLDLYKMAAYYIFAMRFGLVDSLERNAQYKTYDGYHWHLEPWDMDIALGNQNTGGIAFNPPIDRDTTFKLDATKYAFAGKVGRAGTVSQSNWLWDALEGWDYWMKTIVPKVAHALFVGDGTNSETRLTYENVSNMFDNEYQNKWCETLYNESCNHKYIISRGGDNQWLAWLQGARTTHRHWWLSTSMNYYDAKWSCGAYKSKSLYIATSHNDPSGPPQDPNWDGQPHIIKIVPSTDTFISIEQNNGGGVKVPLAGVPSSISCSPNNPAKIDITHIAFDPKVPILLYGCAFYEEIDLSIVARQASLIKFGGCYDNVLGATLKKVNIGCPITRSNTSISGDVYTGYVNGIENFGVLHKTDAETGGDDVPIGEDVFKSLQEYNIEGLLPITSIYSDIRLGNLTELTHFYARGTGLDAFYSAEEGNRFETLYLPGVNRYSNKTSNTSEFTILDLKDTTWNTLEFWDGYIDASTNICTYTKTNASWGVRFNIPITLKTVKFEGSTAKTYNSMRFILNWIATLEKWLDVEINENYSRVLGGKVEGQYDYTNCETIEDALRVELRNRQLVMHGIQWDSTTLGDHELLSFEQLSYIAEFNRGEDNNTDANKPSTGGVGNFTGYIELSRGSSELSAEQLTKIKSWFGDGVFTKNSKGLVIDQNLPYTRISVGGDAYTEYNPESGQEEIYLSDGCIATLGATKFSLSNKKRTVYWYLQDPTNSNIQSDTSLYFCELIKDAHDNYSLLAKESQNGEDYDIIVGCSIIAAEQDDEEDTTGSDFSAEILIHIKAVKYPESVELIVDNSRNIGWQTGNSLRTFTINKSENEKITSYIFWKTGLTAEFYPKFNDYDASNPDFAHIQTVLYSIFDGQGRPLMQNISWDTFKRPKSGQSGGQYNIGDSDNYLKYIIDAEYKYGIVLTVPSQLPSTDYKYTLNIVIKYESGKTNVLEAQLVVMDDAIPVLSRKQNDLVSAIDTKYEEINQNTLNRPYYKSDLLSLAGKLSFINYPNIENLTSDYVNNANASLTNASIFEFLPNITEIDLSGCNKLRLKNYSISQSAAEDKYNLSFRNCTNLQSLKLTGCTSLGKDTDNVLEFTKTTVKNYTIDLTYCTKLTEVYGEGTYVDFTLPSNGKLTQMHYGHPKNIELINQNSLDSSTVSITSNANITKIKLTTDNTQKIGLFNILTNILMATPV
jgi:hypothetical protein